MDVNANGQNTYKKADFCTYNIADANTDMNTSYISVISKKIDNNTNNIGINQLRKVDEA